MITAAYARGLTKTHQILDDLNTQIIEVARLGHDELHWTSGIYLIDDDIKFITEVLEKAGFYAVITTHVKLMKTEFHVSWKLCIDKEEFDEQNRT